MSEKIRKLENDSEYLEAFLDKTEVAEQKLSSEKTENNSLFGRDNSAPDGEKTVDAVSLANRILGIARERHPEQKMIQHLAGLYEKIDEAFENFSALRERRYADYEEHFSVIRELKTALSPEYYSEIEFQEVAAIFSSIREEIFNSAIAELLFVPNFQTLVYTRNIDMHLRGEVVMKGEKPVRIGNFVGINADEKIRLHKIPLALGLESWHILGARSENIFELRNVRLKMKVVPHRDTGHTMLVWESLPARPYEDAKERIEAVRKNMSLEAAEKEKYCLEDEHPEIINLEREKKITITEHSSFGIALLGASGGSLDELVENLKKMSKEEIGNLRTIMVDNRGDSGERKWFGHSPKKGGKPAGLGFPGGSTESDKYGEVLDEDLQRMLPGQLSKEALQDDFLYKIIGHFVREYQNESCHEVLKIFGRIARIQKGKNHVDHFWLAAAAAEGYKPAKEIHEIKKTVCLTLNELFSLPVGGLDVLNHNQRAGLPYFGQLMVLTKFFEKHQLLMIAGTEAFLKRVGKKK